jgi:anti-sigma B factor antagonist
VVKSDVERRDGWVIVAISGEIDVHSSAQLRDEIAAAHEDDDTRLLLDLSGVTFIDSTALSVMVAAHKRLRRHGHALRVVAGHSVQRVLGITGLDRVFEVHDSLDDALP